MTAAALEVKNPPPRATGKSTKLEFDATQFYSTGSSYTSSGAFTIRDAIERACRAAGLEPPEHAPAPGRWVRCDVAGAGGRGRGDGSLYVFPDQMGAIAHNWRTDERATEFVDLGGDPAERALRAALAFEARQRAEERRRAEALEAVQRAEAIWRNSRPADPAHPYLQIKRIAPHGLRQNDDALVARIQDTDGRTRSLQFIMPDGSKRLLRGGEKRGHYIVATGDLTARRLVIAEGFATTVSAVEGWFRGACGIAAIDCGNLLPVARAIRWARPDAEIIIAADDDRLTLGNPGLTRAAEAARAIGAALVSPKWPDGAPETLTDFNDLAVWLAERGARHG